MNSPSAISNIAFSFCTAILNTFPEIFSFVCGSIAVTVLPIRALQRLNSICGDRPERSGLVPYALDSELKEVLPVRADIVLRLKVELVLKIELEAPPKREEELLSSVSELENNEDRSGLDICVKSMRKKSALIEVPEDVTF